MRAKEFLVEYNREITARQVGDNLLYAVKQDTGSLTAPMIDALGYLYSRSLSPEYIESQKGQLIQKVLSGIEEKDPTPNKQYTPWLARMYAKTGIKYEDLNRNNMLGLYDLAKKKRKLRPEDTDINKFKSYSAFETTMYNIYNGFQDLIDDNITGEKPVAKKIYEDSDLIIIVPENEAAACKYGRGTRWCTAATQGYNYFNSYNRDGPLFILIPKNPNYDGEKYQLHFQTRQYMNEEDAHVSLSSLIKRFPNSNLKEWFLENDADLKYTVEFASDEVLQQILDSLKEEVEPVLHEQVTEWELDDQYYFDYLKDEGYVDEDNEVDWDRVEKDGKTYMEYDDSARRWYKTNYEIISDVTPSDLRNMDQYLMDEYYDEEGHHIRYIPDLIAKYYKESENSTWAIREYGEFILKFLMEKVTISYSSTDNKYQVKLL